MTPIRMRVMSPAQPCFVIPIIGNAPPPPPPPPPISAPVMRTYDVSVVLTSVGLLKLLVDLAIEQDANLPALVYESRPTVSSSSQLT